MDWQSFWDSPPGQAARAWEEASCARLLRGLGGSRALQLGRPELDCLSSCAISRRYLVGRAPVRRAGDDWRLIIDADPRHLPLADDCLDLAVWPHGLDERDARPAEILAELSRALAPEGLLVLTFFNSWGWWRWRHALAGSFLPRAARPRAPGAARAALRAAGLTPEAGFLGVYGGRPAAGPNRLELAGARWWPLLGNLVILAARKKRGGLLLVGRAAFAGGRGARRARPCPEGAGPSHRQRR